MRWAASSWHTLRGRGAAFRNLSPAERRIILVAGVAFPLVAVSLRVCGLSRVQQALLRRPLHRLLGPARSLDRSCIAGLVETAARTGLRKANCLERSLVLMWVLHSLGSATELRLGAKREAEALLFHAWLEQEGIVINDEPDIAAQYAVFDGAFLPQGMRFV